MLKSRFLSECLLTLDDKFMQYAVSQPPFRRLRSSSLVGFAMRWLGGFFFARLSFSIVSCLCLIFIGIIVFNFALIRPCQLRVQRVPWARWQSWRRVHPNQVKFWVASPPRWRLVQDTRPCRRRFIPSRNPFRVYDRME